MDGSYLNVSFVCTKTDALEVTEVMRDHEVVARNEPHRWERMEELQTRCTKLCEQIEQGEDEEAKLREAHNSHETTALLQLKRVQSESKPDAAIDMCQRAIDIAKHEVDEQKLEEEISMRKNEKEAAKLELDKQEAKNAHMRSEEQELSQKLKATCALVRNEYIRTSIQQQFREGLEGTCYARGRGARTRTSHAKSDVEVFTVSANDYINQMRIKSTIGSTTFATADDTGIFQLRAFVHDLTAQSR
jgi:chromosome segregation ATPase